MEKDIRLNMHLAEDASETQVHAVLDLRGDHFESFGAARRNPTDRPMPVIGEELAIARALNELAGKVMQAAQEKIDNFLVDR